MCECALSISDGLLMKSERARINSTRVRPLSDKLPDLGGIL